MEITLKSVTDQTFTLKVKPENTINEVANLLAPLLFNVFLSYGGKRLSEHHTLSNYNVQNKSTLHFALGKKAFLFLIVFFCFFLM